MIVLVISLPIYVSTAYAVDVEIETIEFHDDNNVKNYVNANSGTMTVEATFSNPIQPDQVEYVEDGGFLDFIPDRFQTCESNKCILVKEYAAKSPGKYTAKLKLNIPGISQEKTAQFCADGQGPDVEILDWGQSKNDLIIIFEADDKKTALGGCLGQAIKEAYLYVNNEAVDKIEFDAINNVEKSSFKIDATQYGGITNKLKICVEVRDVLGNSGLGCKKEYVKLDFDTPVILEESLIVTDENGNVMNFIMGGSEPSTSGDAVTSGETDTNNGGDAITSDVGTEEDTPAQEETNEESEEPGDLAGAAIGNVNTEQSGSSINFDSTTFAQIKINISDTSLKQSKVYGDFSVLNFGKQSSYTKRAPDSCEYFIGDKISECIWKDIIYDGKSEELTVRFHAEDEAGNYDDLETVLPLKPISTEPIITGIYFITKEQQSEKVYLSGIENVWPKPYGYDIAVVVSHPVAFNINKDLQLKFPSELFKDATKKTSGCVELSTGTWECYFNSTKPKLVNGEGEIKVVKSSENDMGIKIDKHNSILSLNVTLDSEAPLIAKGMDIESGAVEKNIIKSDLCPTANGNLKLDFRVGEKNLFKVEATYPEEEAISSDELTIGTCGEAENGIQDCQIIISNILPIPLKDGPILINMTDLAGNYNVVPTTTDVCMPETEVTPDFITTITVDASVNSNSVPSIDKKTLSLTDFPIMLTLKYVLKNKRVRVHSQTITCQEAKNIKFVGEESSINPEEEDNKKDVYFMIKKQTLSENDPNVDPEADQNIDPDVLNLKCKSTMHIQFGDKVFDKFEIEEFDVEIPLYGLAMGD
ncbi:hypothetical protein HON88_04370, partial [Candidatus Woesearchaeota archaeon]|nr:hypothetical protein [Candidatus Woesearchaeota archaeon]